MVRGSTKRIVIIRDIPSNFIEEAILILKNETEIKEDIKDKAGLKAGKSIPDDYLLKEAEAIINSYIKENHLCTLRDRRTDERKGKLRRIFLSNVFLNLVFLGSLAFLVLMLVLLF